MPVKPQHERGPIAGTARDPAPRADIGNDGVFGNDGVTASAIGRGMGWLWHGKMTWLLLVVGMLFIAGVLAMARTVMTQHQARQEVMLHDETLQSLNALLEIVLDAETGQRGFLLTGNRAYLRPYDAARQRLGPQVAALEVVGDRSSDEERAHIARIRHRLDAKFAEMDRTIELGRAGMMPAAIALVQTNAGQQDMTDLRGELAWLRRDQAGQRQAGVDRAQMLGDRLLPLCGLLGMGVVTLVAAALLGERNRVRTEDEARQLSALREANAQTRLLARELNHRVKNLFAVVLSIITISGRKPAPTAEVLDDIRSRVQALSLAHSSSQGSDADETSPLARVITNIMRPYADVATDHLDGRVRLSGEEVILPVRMITPMGMLIHELATNSSKYGALSAATGMVEIAWQIATRPDGGRDLSLDWTETGGPPLAAGPGVPAAPPRVGFGSRLTAMAAQQMGGTLQRTWPQSGVTVNLVCPLP